MPRKPITIMVKEASNGTDLDVTIAPTQLHATFGDDVVWELAAPNRGTFSVRFHVWLFGKSREQSIDDSLTRQIPNPDHVPKGTYSYVVEGQISGGPLAGRTFIIPNCPEIIIQ